MPCPYEGVHPACLASRGKGDSGGRFFAALRMTGEAGTGCGSALLFGHKTSALP